MTTAAGDSVSDPSVELFQYAAEVITLGLKLRNSRELHSQVTLHIFKLLGDSDEDVPSWATT